MKESELLKKKLESMKTDAYYNGAYTQYDGLDVQNLKHPFFDKLIENK